MALASVCLCVVDDPVDCGPLGDEGCHRRRHDDEWCGLEDGGLDFCEYSDRRHTLNLNGLANTLRFHLCQGRHTLHVDARTPMHLISRS